MSDSNATELLRKLLDDCGVEYRIDFDGSTEWESLAGDYSSAVDVGDGKLVFTGCLTPQQAIAATLGTDDRISERLRGIAYDMRNIGASSMTPRELFAYWAREVDKAADLAAMLGRGECEWVLEHSGTLFDKWRCSECGYLFVEPRCVQGYNDIDPNFCMKCGKAVVR